MDIEFYTCTDAPNKLEKAPVSVITLQGRFNSNVDVVNPVITVAGKWDFQSNYVHIPLFNRWYWIEDVETVTNKQFTIMLAVDVLQSFKEYITTDNIKCYDGKTRVDSDKQPFKNKHIILSTIEGVS